MIYVTFFDPDSKAVQSPSSDSGFSCLEEVELINGEPLRRGKRTRTYRDAFYSDYSLTEPRKDGRVLQRD